MPISRSTNQSDMTRLIQYAHQQQGKGGVTNRTASAANDTIWISVTGGAKTTLFKFLPIVGITTYMLGNYLAPWVKGLIGSVMAVNGGIAMALLFPRTREKAEKLASKAMDAPIRFQ